MKTDKSVMKQYPTNKRFLLVLLAVLITLAAATLTCVNKDKNKEGLKYPPKNIIIFIADGCGYYHVDTASLFQYGDTGVQLYQKFPVTLAMTTYAAAPPGSYDPNIAWSDFDYVKTNTTDSAAAATAMSTGVKTYNGAIGVGLDRKPTKNLIERCEELGKATGVVTSVQLSHATPAGFVAHNTARSEYEQIARQMIYNSAVDVIMGCGHPFYDGDGNLEQTPKTYKFVGGESTWNDLVAGTAASDADGDGIDDQWTLIQTRTEFQALTSGSTPKRVLGVPQVHATLQQDRSGDPNAAPYDVSFIESVPTLEEMTKAAINVLDNDPDGFFMMVEAGAVDWASHHQQPQRLIEEQIAFNEAIKAAIEWLRKNSNWDQTLLIITGDHETGYLTGPDSGHTQEGPVWYDLTNYGQAVQPGMQFNSSGHTNSLIPIYAKGRGARLFRDAAVNTDPVRGQYIDNTDIANIIFALID
jgi:alkaline phosphatase